MLNLTPSKNLRLVWAYRSASGSRKVRVAAEDGVW